MNAYLFPPLGMTHKFCHVLFLASFPLPFRFVETPCSRSYLGYNSLIVFLVFNITVPWYRYKVSS